MRFLALDVVENASPLAITLILSLLAFLCGSLPFSVWLGRLLTGRDVRQVGDGNPGATNAYRAGGRLVGLLALMLDISKGAAPVGWTYFTLGWRGWPMLCVALAPILGHAFSPFLRFKGGKAVAVSLGVWIGLTLWKVSLPAVLLVLAGYALLDSAGWAVMLTLGGLLIVLLIGLPDPLLLGVLAGQVTILGWKHRADLRRWPHLRAAVIDRLRPS